MANITKVELKGIIGALMEALIEYADGCDKFTPEDAQGLLEDMELLKTDDIVITSDKAVWLTCDIRLTSLGRECLKLYRDDMKRWLVEMAAMRRDNGIPAAGDDKLLGR